MLRASRDATAPSPAEWRIRDARPRGGRTGLACIDGENGRGRLGRKTNQNHRLEERDRSVACHSTPQLSRLPHKAGCLTPALPCKGHREPPARLPNSPRPRQDRTSWRPPSRPALHRRFRFVQAQLRRSHERRELNMAVFVRHANGNRRITRISLPICAPPQNPKPRWPKDPRQLRTPQQIAERAAPATDTFLSRRVVFATRSAQAFPALPMRRDKVLNLRADSRRARTAAGAATGQNKFINRSWMRRRQGHFQSVAPRIGDK